MSNQHPITREEMVQIFGEEMPIEAVRLLWDSPGEMTLGELRAKLRDIAAEHPGTQCGPFNPSDWGLPPQS